MDLILFQPGDKKLIVDAGNSTGNHLSRLKKSVSNNDNLVFDPENCIELVSVNQGVKQQEASDVSNGSRASGYPVVSHLACVKYVDFSSPLLYERCLRATSLDDGKTPCYIHVLRKYGDQLNLIMQYALFNTLISDIQFQSHPDDMATEQIQLNFSKIQWSHQGPGRD